MNNELYHHGILGMHWGIRRYQSYDEVPRGSGKSGKEIGEAKGGDATDRPLSKKQLKRKSMMNKAAQVYQYKAKNKDADAKYYRDSTKRLEKTYEKKYSGPDGVKKWSRDMYGDETTGTKKEMLDDLEYARKENERMAKLYESDGAKYRAKATAFMNASAKDLNRKNYREAKRAVNRYMKSSYGKSHPLNP